MSVTEWIRLFWETPEQQARRRREAFMLQMMENPDETIAESLRQGAEEIRRRKELRGSDLSKAA